MNRFTRRELAAALSASAVLAARSQAQPPGQSQALPANPDEELKASLAQLRDNAAQLDSFPLPIAAEPATIFKP
jgi:hypothetical protein